MDYRLRPQKLKEAGILIVVDEQYVPYGTYTNGGEAYTGDITIADVGRVQSHTYPPESLPYSPYYENPNYNEVYDCIRNWVC